MTVRCEAAPAPPGPADELSISEIRRDALEFLSRLVGDFGDVVAYRTAHWSSVLLNHPDHVQRVLLENFRNYEKEGTPDLMMLKPMLGDGLLTSSGAAWARQRQVLSPVFHRRQIHDYAQGIVRCAETVLAAWSAPSSTPVEIVGAMTELTLRIVSSVLFGYDVGGAAQRFGSAVDVLNEVMGGSELGSDAAPLEAWEAALAIVRHNVARVILRGAGAPDGALGRLMRELGLEDQVEAVSDPSLNDQVLTLLLAGHETTAKVLAWTLHLLSRHPQARGALLDEVDARLGDRAPTWGDLEQMPYTWAVLREAMRLRPPIWLMTRRAVEGDEVGGFSIAAGTIVAFSPFLLHRRPDFWAEPEAYRPERFLDVGAGWQHPFAFLPFSGGPRHCVGQEFAALEMRLVLPMLLQRFEFTPADHSQGLPEALVTLRPSGGLPFHVRRRTG